MFKIAFWKDAAERCFGTLLAVMIGLWTTDGFNLSSLTHWEFWGPVIVTVGVTLFKTMAANLNNPNTGGALFGTAVPAGQVVAAVDVKSEEVVAAEASPLQDGTLVHVVTDLPPTTI